MTPLVKKIDAQLAVVAERIDGLRAVTPSHGPVSEALEWVLPLREALAEVENLLVRQARVEGLSWAEVADPLGLTRQGAQQRWG